MDKLHLLKSKNFIEPFAITAVAFLAGYTRVIEIFPRSTPGGLLMAAGFGIAATSFQNYWHQDLRRDYVQIMVSKASAIGCATIGVFLIGKSLKGRVSISLSATLRFGMMELLILGLVVKVSKNFIQDSKKTEPIEDSKKTEPEVTVEKELMELAKACKEWTYVEKSSRAVVKGKDKEDFPRLFIKTPYGRFLGIQENLLKYDQLAFELSHAIGFNVVPPSVIIESKKLSQNISSNLLYQEKNSILQMSVGHWLSLRSQENVDYQRVILFNMLVGRHDAREENSFLGYEIDNEQIGNKSTDSYLLDQISGEELNTELIEWFLQIDEEKIKGVFKKIENLGFGLLKEKEENILYNLDKIKVFFRDNGKIYVKDLKEINK